MMRLASYVATFIGGLVGCYLLISLGIIHRAHGLPGTQQEPTLDLPTYLSFLSVMMTAVTAVLAAIAIFIGVVAAVTFRELSEKAEQAAQRRADEALSETVIRARIDAIAFKSMKPASLDELKEGFDPTDSGER